MQAVHSLSQVPIRHPRSVITLLCFALAWVAGCGTEEETSSGTRSYEFLDEIAKAPADALVWTVRAAIDPTDGTIVVERSDGAVFRTDDSGTSAIPVAKGDGRGVWIDRGRITVLQAGRLAIFDTDGHFEGLKTIRDGNTELGAQRLRGGAAGGLLVIDVDKQRRGLFDRSGHLVTWLPAGVRSPFVVQANGFVITPSDQPETLTVLDLEGNVVDTWQVGGTPLAMSADPDGNVVLLRLTASSRFLLDHRRIDGTSLGGEVLMDYWPGSRIDGLSVGPDGTVVITDESPGVTMVRDGRTIGRFGHPLGTGAGVEIVATRILGRPQGGVAVVDTGGTLHRYSALGHYQGMQPVSTRFDRVLDMAMDGTHVVHLLIDPMRITQVIPNEFNTRIDIDLSELSDLGGFPRAFAMGLDTSGRELVSGVDQQGLWIARLAPELGIVRAHHFEPWSEIARGRSIVAVERIFPLRDGGVVAISQNYLYHFSARLELLRRTPMEQFTRPLLQPASPARLVTNPERTEILALVSVGRSLHVERYTPDGAYLGLLPVDIPETAGLRGDTIVDCRTNDGGQILLLTGDARVFRLRPVN